MGVDSERNVHQIKDRVLTVPITIFGRVTVSLPLFGLIFCFVTAVIFQFNEVNKTMCSVQNYIPSISAITGVAPQRYVWRLCIALHSAPRFVVGMVYYNYYMDRMRFIATKHHGRFRLLARIAFWTYTIENSCLCLVSYIANVENYPLHEKIFVVFMVASLLYEFLAIVLFKWAHVQPMEPSESTSYRLKKMYFASNLSFTAGLLYFFMRHRLYCEPGAFNFFSLFEYGIAIVNILFHYTATYEFSGLKWYLARPSTLQADNNHHKWD